MKTEKIARLQKSARVLRLLSRIEKLAEMDRTQKLFQYVAHFFMPVESLLDKEAAKGDPVLQEINRQGGIRPWLRMWIKRGKSMGAPPDRILEGVYYTLKETVEKHEGSQ